MPSSSPSSIQRGRYDSVSRLLSAPTARARGRALFQYRIECHIRRCLTLHCGEGKCVASDCTRCPLPVQAIRASRRRSTRDGAGEAGLASPTWMVAWPDWAASSPAEGVAGARQPEHTAGRDGPVRESAPGSTKPNSIRQLPKRPPACALTIARSAYRIRGLCVRAPLHQSTTSTASVSRYEIRPYGPQAEDFTDWIGGRAVLKVIC